ncbi:MAG: TVP38/TMEM64 family protein [Desulfamplus sp.]|nr:TVP38/TMEM64 family protein [Desulfamplus sp.]MBF0389712.1 TVP38/TMEM64 family protein [Desulfamplus sp.]
MKNIKRYDKKRDVIVRSIVVLVIVAIIGLFFALDIQKYLTFEYLKSSQKLFQSYYTENQLITIVIYMALYITITSLSLPGAVIMTLAGGALFGLWLGLLLVSFASTIGATISFLAARFLLKDYVQQKLGEKLKAANDGIEKDGAFYLFTLRLVPLFPFFIINLVMGLTSIRTSIFYIVSQIGMLPGTFVYINAGRQLGKIESLTGILSVELILSFVLLGIFPLAAKKALALVRPKKY